MEPTFKLTQTNDKDAAYKEFILALSAFIKDENDFISVLANTTAALKEAFGFYWIGFYLVKDGMLHLGPFQGSVACYSINKGRGVCGKAWEERRTQVVQDVDLFPGHIACSSLSRSEIVVPLFTKNGEVIGVLDIDSDQLATFDEVDKGYLEKIAEIVVNNNVYD